MAHYVYVYYAFRLCERQISTRELEACPRVDELSYIYILIFAGIGWRASLQPAAGTICESLCLVVPS